MKDSSILSRFGVLNQRIEEQIYSRVGQKTITT